MNATVAHAHDEMTANYLADLRHQRAISGEALKSARRRSLTGDDMSGVLATLSDTNTALEAAIDEQENPR